MSARSVTKESNPPGGWYDTGLFNTAIGHDDKGTVITSYPVYMPIRGSEQEAELKQTLGELRIFGQELHQRKYPELYSDGLKERE